MKIAGFHERPLARNGKAYVLIIRYTVIHVVYGTLVWVDFSPQSQDS